MTPIPKPLTEVARKLRHDLTDSERKLWSRIRAHQLGVHFRRQAPLGPYVLDFVCFSARLVIEADGGQHADSEKDCVRDAWLQAQGFRVQRFWNNEVLQNIDGVLETIMTELGKLPRNQAPPPRPSPVKGEGEDQWAPSVLSTFAGDNRSAPPAPSPLAGADQSAPPALSPLAGADRSAPPAPSPLVGEGWGGGQ